MEDRHAVTGLLDCLAHHEAGLRRVLQEFRAETVTGGDAKRALEGFAALERLAAAGKVLAAGRVAATGAWSGGAHRSAAHWVAAVTGDSVGSALGAIEAARNLADAPATEEALRLGRLSVPQAREVAAAATVDRLAEEELLAKARQDSLQALREECRRVRAAAQPDERAYERIHRRRSLRRWVDADGTFRLDGHFTPDAGARLWARIEDEAGRVFDEARRAGSREPTCAYAADALVRLVVGEATSEAKTAVVVRVDHRAYARGRTEPGEVCEIDGVGSVPVAVAHRLAADSFVAAAAVDGADITAISHLGRTINARLRTALMARDPVCVVPGCGNRRHLEIDHIVPFAQGGPTELANLARLCAFHHRQKTVQGFRLSGGPGNWAWHAPPDRRSGAP